ncbi:2-oxoacid:ferredoxin oxidoreductase subunit beta [Desulforhopalus singaporensis]|uniref:2-oxoglutarate ferredoxin oxidoreductase subunit beta n=1 Tax=Desulforhopalus singaporensis TaxID=91360 RepID=A0A1H0Q7Y0_9BACT|nr:2-oxoacid:ferredoxin oxidoreductase subunit beta [Desulforhopalus singaporensis]SDP13434.1 2-oxoglutarate ferredoxin oxidoreductase subunit beta [Desulforhopalus singaporensis]
MTSTKPAFRHPKLAQNSLGLTRKDYEGAVSTLCAGCGHDSTTNAIIQACFELNIEPHRVAKMSGIGCSSKTPAYFLDRSHGFNAVHGRMPSIATGANMANRDLLYIGISGDGDTASIGMGQFAHALRRNLNLNYICMNNGCYGLTKGQDSATADMGSTGKRGIPNPYASIDLCELAIELGASYVARGFSGDKKQLVPLIKGAFAHSGLAFIDVISPCVTFNNTSTSTKSYEYVREHIEATNTFDFIPLQREILTDYAEGTTQEVIMHDGSIIHLHKVDSKEDVTNRLNSVNKLEEEKAKGRLLTGLLYVNQQIRETHDILNTSLRPLNSLTENDLCPGNTELQKINDSLR